METVIGKTLLRITDGDICQQDTAAVVNSTNPSLCSNDPVDLVLRRAGGIDFLKACRYHVARHGRCAAGEAVVTGAGRLGAEYVIHAVGPEWTGNRHHEEKLLRQAYWNALLRAEELGVSSVAIPPIGAGVPVETAAKIALAAVRDFLLKERNVREIRFVLPSKYDAAEYERVWEHLSRAASLLDQVLQVRQYA